MTAPVDTVKRFYNRLKVGDVPGLVELMTDDIGWETMLDFGLDERGPQPIVDKILAPLMDEWASFSPEPHEFIRARTTQSSRSGRSRACIAQREDERPRPMPISGRCNTARWLGSGNTSTRVRLRKHVSREHPRITHSQLSYSRPVSPSSKRCSCRRLTCRPRSPRDVMCRVV
jgi:hypothetical protein